jgi:hypothetical protein
MHVSCSHDAHKTARKDDLVLLGGIGGLSGSSVPEGCHCRGKKLRGWGLLSRYIQRQEYSNPENILRGQ